MIILIDDVVLSFIWTNKHLMLLFYLALLSLVAIDAVAVLKKRDKKNRYFGFSSILLLLNVVSVLKNKDKYLFH